MATNDTASNSAPNKFTLLSDEEFCTLVRRSYETLTDGDGATVEDASAYLDSFASHRRNMTWRKGDCVFTLLAFEGVVGGIMFYSTRSYTHQLDYADQLDYNDELARQTRLITSLYGSPTDREFTPTKELTWRLPAGGGIVLKAERDIEVDVLTVTGLHVHDVAFKPRPEYF